MRLPSLFAVLFSLCGSFTGLAQLIPVPNHSFETNTTDGGTTYQVLYEGFNGLPGWRWSTSPAPVLIGNPPDNPDYAYAALFGKWQLDLSGSDNTTGGWIETTLTGLEPGVRYLGWFMFGTSRDFLSDNSPVTVAVSINGQEVQRSEHKPTKVLECSPMPFLFVAPENEACVLRFTNLSKLGTGLVSIDELSLEKASHVVFPNSFFWLQSVKNETRVHVVFRGSLLDGTNFVGQVEESTNLINWTSISNPISPLTIEPTAKPRFFRLPWGGIR